MGAGMCNIAVMYQGMTALSFSVARGGDWIDECVSQDTGVSKAKVVFYKPLKDPMLPGFFLDDVVILKKP